VSPYFACLYTDQINVGHGEPNPHKFTINLGGFTLTKVCVQGIYTNGLTVCIYLHWELSDITINLNKILELICILEITFDSLNKCFMSTLKVCWMAVRAWLEGKLKLFTFTNLNTIEGHVYNSLKLGFQQRY
jgi:hypothetical protein